MIIPIDHGNKQMKTVHKIFTSGLHESEVKPPFGRDVLEYNGKFYSLSENRMSYMRDKTEDNRFFILTLFAIAFEIEEAKKHACENVTDVLLVVGLPPAHYGGQYKRFEKYFIRNREVIHFTFRGLPFAIRITNAISYPQAYAAAMPIYATLAGLPKVTVIDIGGFTADYLQINKGNPDLGMCDSLDYGVIRLYSTIQSKVNSSKAIRLDESEIDAILNGDETDARPDIRALVLQQAQGFANELLGLLGERMIELKSGKVIFVGGGSVLLEKQIEASQKVGDARFEKDIAANVKGYELLYAASQMGSDKHG